MSFLTVEFQPGFAQSHVPALGRETVALPSNGIKALSIEKAAKPRLPLSAAFHDSAVSSAAMTAAVRLTADIRLDLFHEDGLASLSSGISHLRQQAL